MAYPGMMSLAGMSRNPLNPVDDPDWWDRYDQGLAQFRGAQPASAPVASLEQTIRPLANPVGPVPMAAMAVGDAPTRGRYMNIGDTLPGRPAVGHLSQMRDPMLEAAMQRGPTFNPGNLQYDLQNQLGSVLGRTQADLMFADNPLNIGQDPIQGDRGALAKQAVLAMRGPQIQGINAQLSQMPGLYGQAAEMPLRQQQLAQAGQYQAGQLAHMKALEGLQSRQLSMEEERNRIAGESAKSQTGPEALRAALFLEAVRETDPVLRTKKMADAERAATMYEQRVDQGRSARNGEPVLAKEGEVNRPESLKHIPQPTFDMLNAAAREAEDDQGKIDFDKLMSTLRKNNDRGWLNQNIDHVIDYLETQYGDQLNEHITPSALGLLGNYATGITGILTMNPDESWYNTPFGEKARGITGHPLSDQLSAAVRERRQKRRAP